MKSSVAVMSLSTLLSVEFGMSFKALSINGPVKTAAKMKEGGYNMVSTVNDAYRVYSNNVSGPWVQDGKIVIDDALKAWVDASKAMVDAAETTTSEL